MAVDNPKFQAMADAAKRKLGTNTSAHKQGINQGKPGVSNLLAMVGNNSKTPDVKP
jgi:hypothetical protein